MNTAALAFAVAELGLAINVVLWPLAGHPWWTAVAWSLAMVAAWPIHKWSNP